MNIVNENNVMTVYLTGEIDHHTARGIREHTDTMLVKRRPERLVLDFSGVSFMDSSGVGLVMGRYKTAAALNCSTVVRGLRPRDRKIMEMSGLKKLVTFQNQEDTK